MTRAVIPVSRTSSPSAHRPALAAEDLVQDQVEITPLGA